MSLIGEIINYYKLPDRVKSSLSSFANAHRVVGNLILYVSDDIGDDSYDGLSVLTPFLTIQKAIDEVKTYIIDSDASVTINVASGTYILTDQILADITQGENVSIIGADVVETTLDIIESATNITDWSADITLSVGSTTGMEEGDIIMITECDYEDFLPTESTGSALMNGAWEIIAFPVSGQVTIRYDHFYEHWSLTPPTQYQRQFLPGMDTELPFSYGSNPSYPQAVNGTVRCIKTNLKQTSNAACIRLRSNAKLSVDKLSFNHDIAGIDPSRYGIVSDLGSVLHVGSDTCFRKCVRGLNAHSGGIIYTASETTASTCYYGYMANIGSEMYLSQTFISNCLIGYDASITSVIVCGQGSRLRAYNNNTAFDIAQNSSIFSNGSTGRKGHIGLKLTHNSNATTGNDSRFGRNTYGCFAEYRSVVIMGNGAGIQHCLMTGLVTITGSFVKALTSNITNNTYNYQNGTDGTSATPPVPKLESTDGCAMEIS